MASEKDYTEARWRRTAAKTLGLTSILGILAFAAAVIFDIDFLGYGLLISVILFAPAVTLAGDTRYADVSITATDLVVGKDRIPLTDIDPDYGVRQHADMSEWARAAISNIHNTHPVEERGGPQAWRADLEAEGFVLLGGAWGIGVLRKALFVRSLTGGQHTLVIPSAAPEKTAKALREAIAEAGQTSP